MHYQPEDHTGLSSAENIDRINAKTESDDARHEARMNEIKAQIFEEPDEVEKIMRTDVINNVSDEFVICFADKYLATALYTDGVLMEVYDIEEV